MVLKISEIRKLCNLWDCRIEFLKFLSDSEVGDFLSFSKDNPSARYVLDDGTEISRPLVDAQQRLYDDLELYIKFLQELAKFRPLPF